MTLYQQLFSEATGITDPIKLNRLESIVREEYSVLDNLTASKLKRVAKIAVLVMKELGEL